MISLYRMGLSAALALLTAACGASSNPGTSGSGGVTAAGGQSGGGGSGGAATGGAPGGGGSSGSGGTASGGAGGTSSAASGGQAGAASGGTSGAPGDAAADTSGGGTGDATGADMQPAAKPGACPAGPFGTPQAGAARAVCGDIQLRYGWSEGPTWVASEKAFFFSNFVIQASGPGDMIKYSPETDKCEFFVEGNGCNGLGVTPNGKLIAACHTPRAILEYDLATKQSKVLLNMAEGKMLDSPNDLVAHSNGTIFFTNPIFELGGRPQGLGNALVKINPAGMVTVLARGGLNGITLSHDEERLYVVGMGVWDVDPQGELSNRRAFDLGGDGIAMDCAGNVYTNGGAIKNPAGMTIANFPGGTNMAFGGVDGKTLLVVANRSARVVQMSVPGLP